jgi:hypothetical protein
MHNQFEQYLRLHVKFHHKQVRVVNLLNSNEVHLESSKTMCVNKMTFDHQEMLLEITINFKILPIFGVQYL